MPIQLDPDICCKRMNRVELKHSGMTPRTEWLELGPSSGVEVVPQTISALMLWPPAVPRIMNAVQFGGFGWLLPPSLPPWSFLWFAAFAVESAPVSLTVCAVAADNPHLLDKIFFFQHNSKLQQADKNAPKTVGLHNFTPTYKPFDWSKALNYSAFKMWHFLYWLWIENPWSNYLIHEKTSVSNVLKWKEK